MIADAALRIIVSEPQTLFTTGCSLPGVLTLSVCFLFFIYRTCFPFFFPALLFCWRLTAAAATYCETNSLDYGRKFPIAKARLLTLTQTRKQAKDECSRRQSGYLCPISMCKVRPARLWRNVDTPAGSVNLLTEHARRHFNTPLACGHVVIFSPGYQFQA